MESSKKKKLTSCYQRDCASGSCVMHTCVLRSRARQAALFVPQTLLFPPQTCKHAPIWSVAETIYLDFSLTFFFIFCHFPYVVRTMFPSAGLARLFTLMRCPPPVHRVVRREAVLQRHGSSRRAKRRHTCRARAKPNPKTRKVIGRLAGAAGAAGRECDLFWLVGYCSDLAKAHFSSGVEPSCFDQMTETGDFKQVSARFQMWNLCNQNTAQH